MKTRRINGKEGEHMLSNWGKRMLAFCLSVILLLPAMATAAEQTADEELELIAGRLVAYFLTLDTIGDGAKVETCYVSKAMDYLEQQRAGQSGRYEL